MSDRPTGDLAARDVYQAWADAMDRQGRALAPERRSWDLLPQQEKDLDADIAYQLNQQVRAAARPADGEGLDVERLGRALRAIHGEQVPLPNRPTPRQYAELLAHWYGPPPAEAISGDLQAALEDALFILETSHIDPEPPHLLETVAALRAARGTER